MAFFHQINIKLPFKPDLLHAYILQSEEDPELLVLIDTGVNRQESIDDLTKGIKNIDPSLSIENIGYIIGTHGHVDHIGAMSLIQERSNAKIILHKEEYNYFKFERVSLWISDILSKYGVPLSEIEKMKVYNDFYSKYFGKISPDILLEGKTGNVPVNFPETVKFILTPGHSPNHLAVLLEDQKVLFTGDTILSGISPNLGFSGIHANPVAEFSTTLKMLKDYQGWTAYPSHQKIITDICSRADQLLALQNSRLKSVKSYFDKKNHNKKGFPSLIKYLYPTVWNDPIQRFLALMETQAYIKYFFGLGTPFKPPFEPWN
ncbi:MAG: MBL fold metallo-hydrolase [Candidatus Hodarchaeales archaeon]